MKKALYAFVVLVLLGGIGVYLAFNYVDVIVKWTIERYGPDVAGVQVTVREVHISPRDGKGTIRGLEIGNPSGFTAPRAARVGEMRVALDPATLGDDVVMIRELVIEAPQITYERGSKATNLDVIQSHVDAYVKRASAGEGSAKGGAPRAKRRFIIQRFVIRGAQVTMTNPALRGQGIGFELPDVQLTDVGRRQGGVTASEAAAIVASALQNRIAQKLLTNIDLLRKGGIEGAVDALRGLLK